MSGLVDGEVVPLAAERTRRPAEAKRVVVKLGTSSLTSGDGMPDRHRLQQVTEQLLSLHRSGVEIVIVSSGAIAAGMSALGLERRPSDMPTLQAAALAADRNERPAEAKRVVVKLGTSSLTSGDGMPDRQRLQQVTGQLLSLHRSGVEIVIVSSGAIAAGMSALGLERRPSDMPT
ncbi:MAG TPA: hypothetical protein VG779_11790, partial [Actinomycetota bacterium]|nr:hypothetical protein [Actinomycetota bacterium]